MLNVVIQKKSALNIYTKCNLDILKKDYFSLKDWEALYTIKFFLDILLGNLKMLKIQSNA